MESDLDWLPDLSDWQQSLEQAKHLNLREAVPLFRKLANSRMDLARTARLDRELQAALSAHEVQIPSDLLRVRLAVLGSSTLTHLLPAIRIGGLRHNLLIEIYEAPYGTYWQELADVSSAVHAFQPTAMLLALDARHVTAMGYTEKALDTMRACWRMAKEAFGCLVVQQAIMPVLPVLLGNEEHRYPESSAAIVEHVNQSLRSSADENGVAVLALDQFAPDEGLRRWHDPALWYRAKQEVHPAMAPLYGEQVARLLGAQLGQSRKCLVLDLDHTLWGGGIGDDGLEGIVIGQGSAAGEAHLELQLYAKSLMARGIVLAVCSKNDEANALLPFERHADMVLRREHIACFVANWEDKAANLRRIASTLNLGLDSLVFVDDNPAERALIRRELPMVAVPEMPEDPAEYVRVLSRAGYFEAVGITPEDRERAAQYVANAKREAARIAVGAVTDLGSYLADLRMELEWKPFDAAGRARIVQLINKTNQFNLTTRRVAEREIEQVIGSDNLLGLQFRLKDAYGDNGIIGVILCQPASVQRMQAEGFRVEQVGTNDFYIDLWLMSCRVLGRQVDEAMMNVLAEQARNRGIRRIFGQYIPTAKNAMVRDHYGRLGFELVGANAAGSTLWTVDVAACKPRETYISSISVQPPAQELAVQSDAD